MADYEGVVTLIKDYMKAKEDVKAQEDVILHHFQTIWQDILEYLSVQELLPEGYDRLLRIKQKGWEKVDHISMKCTTGGDIFAMRVEQVTPYKDSVWITVRGRYQGCEPGIIYLPYKCIDHFSVEYVEKKFDYELKLQKAHQRAEENEKAQRTLEEEYQLFLEMKKKFEGHQYDALKAKFAEK